MRLLTFELSNGRGPVIVNPALVRGTEPSGCSKLPSTKLIFDEDDHLDVSGSLADVTGKIGLGSFAVG